MQHFYWFCKNLSCAYCK